MVEDLLKNAIDQFNQKSASDEKLKKAVAGLKRTVQVSIDGGETYNFTLDNGKITPLAKGAIENPNVLINSDADTLSKVLKKEMSAMKAYATKKIKIKAALADLLALRSLLGQ